MVSGRLIRGISPVTRWMVIRKLAGAAGFEPTSQGFGDPHLAIRTRPCREKILVARGGIEPPPPAFYIERELGLTFK